MGFFDKVLFWKKEEKPFIEPGAPIPGFDVPHQDSNFDAGFQSSYPKTGLESVPSFQQQRNQGYDMDVSSPMHSRAMRQDNSQDIIMNKSMEVISSKLDALQATLESINQRLTTIERVAEIEQQRTTGRRYGY